MAVGAKDALSCTASTAKTNGLIGHDRGVERQFSELSEPPSAPYPEFPPYPRGGGQDVQQLWGRLDHYLPCVQKITFATNRFRFGQVLRVLVGGSGVLLS